MSNFNLIFLCTNRPNFFQQDLNQKPASIKGRFDSKTNDIDNCFKILMAQKVQKIVIGNDSSGILKRCFSVTRGLLSFMGVTISNLTLRKKMRFKFQSAGYLHQNLDTPKKQKFFIDLCRYSIPYFSVTTGLISSNKFSIEQI